MNPFPGAPCSNRLQCDRHCIAKTMLLALTRKNLTSKKNPNRLKLSNGHRWVFFYRAKAARPTRPTRAAPERVTARSAPAVGTAAAAVVGTKGT